jgi:hypothetical protein
LERFVISIVTITYFAWSAKKENKSTENKQQNKTSRDKKEGKFYFCNKVVSRDNIEYHAFDDVKRKRKNVYVNKNHPRIKELLGEGKLKSQKEKFIIRFSKVNKYEIGNFYYFNKINTDLEIIES